MTKPNNIDPLDEILNAKPDLVPPPDGLWESLRATWTGLWTDWHGDWDERQASDVFPISDLLSEERQTWLKEQVQLLMVQERLEARIDEDEQWLEYDHELMGDVRKRISALKSQLTPKEN